MLTVLDEIISTSARVGSSAFLEAALKISFESGLLQHAMSSGAVKYEYTSQTYLPKHDALGRPVVRLDFPHPICPPIIMHRVYDRAVHRLVRHVQTRRRITTRWGYVPCGRCNALYVLCNMPTAACSAGGAPVRKRWVVYSARPTDAAHVRGVHWLPVHNRAVAHLCRVLVLHLHDLRDQLVVRWHPRCLCTWWWDSKCRE
jgi:hypothetical protein